MPLSLAIMAKGRKNILNQFYDDSEHHEQLGKSIEQKTNEIYLEKERFLQNGCDFLTA